MTAVDDLLDYIEDGKRPALAEFEGWVRGSRRFKAFALRYRDKIRTKLKNVRDANGLQDLRAELETAARLLHDERFTVDYETYAASKQRGPDFTVTYKTHTPFNVEVRRIHSLELEGGDTGARTGKLVAVLLDKAGQMPPSIVNLLWLVTEREIVKEDLTRAAAIWRQLAVSQADPARRGVIAADLNRQYRRLSGIVLGTADAPVLWLNPDARHPVPREIVTAIQRLQSD